MAQGKQTVTDEEILEYFREHTDPAFAIGELVEEFDIGSEGLRKRLNSLVREGQLATKKPGHRTRVYWAPSDTESA